MTIEPGYNDYTTNGVETTFAFDFALEQETDLKVYFTPSGGTYDPATDIITNYVVTINPLPTIGGHIVVTPAPANGGELILRKEMVLEVPTSFADVTTFNGAALDAAIQRLVDLIQQVSFEANNDALHYPPNAPGLNDNITQVGVLGEGQFWQRVGDAIIAVTLSDEPGSSVLSQLASETEGGDGSLLVGTYMPAPDPTPAETLLGGMTVHEALYWAVSQIQVLKANVLTIPAGFISYGYPIGDVSGWVELDDGTIGNLSSGATTRAKTDCETIFGIIWESTVEGWCQIFDSSGNKVAKGASAAADWAANRRIETPKIVNRFLMSGSANSTITQPFTTDFSTSTSAITPILVGEPAVSARRYLNGVAVTLTTTGALPTGLATGTTYYVASIDDTEIRLCTTTANVVAGTYVTFSDNGTGTHTINHVAGATLQLGAFGGNDEVLQLETQMPEHTHTGHLIPAVSAGSGPGAAFDTTVAGVSGSTGGSEPMITVGKYLVARVFMKL